jgi:casein kinase II subunit alpha
MKERLTAKEAQAHPYFNPVRDPEVFKQNLASNGVGASSKA